MLHLAQSGTENPLVPNLTELITGLIAFAIVFGLLAKLLLPRIQKILEERTDAIEGGLKRAEEAQAEAAEVLKQYQAQLADARREASRIREDAKEQGARIIAEMREQGQAEYARLTAAAQAQKVVGESLEDEARQRRTVDRFLEQLEEQPGTAGVRTSG